MGDLSLYGDDRVSVLGVRIGAVSGAQDQVRPLSRAVDDHLKVGEAVPGAQDKSGLGRPFAREIASYPFRGPEQQGFIALDEALRRETRATRGWIG